MSRPTLEKNPRGYVLIIVLVVGLAASLAAVSLSQAAGGAILESMHTDNGDRAQAMAEAGMMRSVAYLQALVGNTADFDAVLDRGLNTSCVAPITFAPDDGTPEWSDSTVVALNTNSGTRGFGCVLVDHSATGDLPGAYLVRFDDDDDDDPWKPEWDQVTGNNDQNGCNEGPDNSMSINGGNYGGLNNSLRDRNRSIWVTTIGVYPATSCSAAAVQNADHRITMRRLHSAPRFPSVPGIQVRGDIIVQGNGKLAACSEIGSLEVDGVAKGIGGAQGCACGFSAANSWATPGNWNHCDSSPLPDCGSSVTPIGGYASYTLPDCLQGRLETPGPTINALPDVVNDADDYINWSRSCVFYVDNNNSAGSGHSLWFWDAARTMDGTQSCGQLEGAGGSFPGPPDPSRACSTATGGGCPNPGWEGCWTPIIIDADSDVTGTTWAGVTSPISGIGDISGWPIPSAGAMAPQFHTGSYGNTTVGANMELAGIGGDASWRPSTTAAYYDTCNDMGGAGDPSGTPWDETNCGEQGHRGHGAGTGTGGPTDYNDFDAGTSLGPLNWKLTVEGMPLYPDQVRLNKPNWATACQVEYPPPVNGTPGTTYNCTTCNGTNTAMHYTGGGSGDVWFSVQTTDEAKAVPAGVYWFSNSITGLSGGNYDFAQVANPLNPANGGSPDPEVNMQAYPLATLMSPGNIQLQQDGYFFGPGQTHNGSNDRWIAQFATNGNVAMQGGGGMSLVGTVYAKGNVAWSGNGTMFHYGELYTDGNFHVSGSGVFWWLYRVSLQEPETGTSGMPATTFRTAY